MKKGLVEIHRNSKDKRSIIIKITKKGKELKKQAISVPKTIAEEHWLTEEETKTYKSLLTKLLEGAWGK